MTRPENSPLLRATSIDLIPPLRSSTPYGVIEVEHDEFKTQRRPHQGGIASVPFVAIIALGIAAALIFGLSTILQPNGNGVSVGTSTQSEPGSASFVDLKTGQGELRGYHKKSRQGRYYTAFYKVPYAAPPLNKLRFRDPQPTTSWEGLRDYKEVARQCIQKEKYSEIDEAVGDEDCLYSNIYVPGLSPSEHSSNLLPTMVYIHGGGFTDGNGSRYGADYFMDEDVVLVTFQFRLGPFGFINTEDGVIRGNMGLKDQVQMLKWVRDNIQYYGGDPKRVTIFGNSGGGMSVSFLMLSPLANGLFHRAITQSGGALCSVSGNLIDESPRKTIEEMGRVLSCPTTDSNEFLDCLETKDATDIALVRTPPTKYGLTVEKTNDSGVFMPRRPLEMMEAGWVNKVPYIIGNVNAEYAGYGYDIIDNPESLREVNEDFGGYFRKAYGINATDEEFKDMRNIYFGEDEITGSNSSIHGMAYMISDLVMIHCSFTGAKFHAKYSPTYLYHLTKPPYKSYIDKTHPGFPAKELGLVTHADELQYFFLYYGYPEIPEGDPEYFEYSKYLVRLWAHFAAEGLPTLESKTWDTVDSDLYTPFWFELGDRTGQTTELQDRMAFWDRFSPEMLRYA